MNKKFLALVISTLAVMMVIPIGISFASKPTSIQAVMLLDATILNAEPVGMNVISERELYGSFTSGPFVGDIYREIRVVQHTQTGKANVQNMVYVENAIVTLDGVVAEGSFVIQVMGMVGNAKWTIISSDLSIGDQTVNLHGQGTATINYFELTDPTHYTIGNVLTGQVSLTP